MIYLDNAATTRVFDCAAKAASDAMTDGFYNPNTTYRQGVEVHGAIEAHRRSIAEAVGARKDEIYFTSCATESNNWALACGRKNQKGNVIISAGEHSSVYEPAMQLKNRGVDVRIVPLTRSGTVDEEAFTRAVDADTTFISIIHASNETGVINPIERLVRVAKRISPRALFHSDGVQALVKTQTPISALGVDLYSASAHKLGAPKGIGLMYVKSGVHIAPLMYGGGQERAARSGTQNTPYIAAFDAALKQFISCADRKKTAELRRELADKFTGSGYTVIGDGDNSGYILSVCVPGVKAEILQNAVNERGIIIGKGAACSGSKRGNRVLSAMGLSPEQVECCIRISLFCDTPADEALAAADTIIQTANSIRSGNV